MNQSASSSDLGASSAGLLTPLTITPAQHRAAARTVAGNVPLAQVLETLQMLGLAPYDRAAKPQPETPIKHGERASYVNRGCGKEGSPPCPASPTCSEQNNAYFRRRRREAAARASKSRRASITIGAAA